MRFSMTQKLLPSHYDEYLDHIQHILIEVYLYKAYLVDLYYSHSNRIDIINDCASTFFVMCENSFIESIIMRISKVTENKHLTIKTLFKCIVPEYDTEYDLINQKLNNLDAQTKNLKERRNKQLGHIDPNSLKKEFPITLTDINNVLDLLEQIFNHIVQRLPNGLKKFKPDTQYVMEPLDTGSGDAVAALIMLEKGRRYDALIEQLPEECIQSLLPSSNVLLDRGFFPGYERHYFEYAVLQFVSPEEI